MGFETTLRCTFKSTNPFQLAPPPLPEQLISLTTTLHYTTLHTTWLSVRMLHDLTHHVLTTCFFLTPVVADS